MTLKTNQEKQSQEGLQFTSNNSKMVRINLIEPKKLSDQHLIAEYNEILMLVGHLNKNPSLKEIPETYVLGKGHIKFFKNKLTYLKDRHQKIKNEMKQRNFRTNKSLELKHFSREYFNKFNPSQDDLKIITSRIREKIKLKPDFYRYYGEKKEVDFFINLLN